jgi:hypothetical protein
MTKLHIEHLAPMDGRRKVLMLFTAVIWSIGCATKVIVFEEVPEEELMARWNDVADGILVQGRGPRCRAPQAQGLRRSDSNGALRAAPPGVRRESDRAALVPWAGRSLVRRVRGLARASKRTVRSRSEIARPATSTHPSYFGIEQIEAPAAGM